MNTLESAMQKIVSEIPGDCIFDSHFVIDALIKHHSDEYLQFAAKFGPSVETEKMHGFIAMEIEKLDVKKMPYKAYSETIHGKPGKCACWKRNSQG